MQNLHFNFGLHYQIILDVHRSHLLNVNFHYLDHLSRKFDKLLLLIINI